MRAAYGDNGRAQAMAAEDLLVDAASNLAVAASLLMATEHVGLRGSAPSPVAPLHSFSDIAGVDEPELNLRDALELLRDARVHADHAWASVQRGRGHLWAAYQLLDHHQLPGVYGLLNNESDAARDDVSTALHRASESVPWLSPAVGWWIRRGTDSA
ncbi:hypothetical protein QOZ80_8AG0630470 [Eleusine coracana subsp. coracana]|nr:hypothetical protein QOZ80_8AG0630470 [Eleusine coracana subsp. coracana]